MKTTEEKNRYKSLDITTLIKELDNLNGQLNKSLNSSQKVVLKKSDLRVIKKNKARVLTIINETKNQTN
ncbi:MAG: hypothetical protein UT11_C0061G0012 [Berkelbacteria bacterium GW2011_GWA2_38_9]|uniref:50S ribosomal protein L29 n=1 Tax=Berkelbacteria bacterium GW2011_GWA2_38_9 TaxID=1618334 RepID=A0A0G0PC41_9BACT|nr:MAG: hypothetical protein UT11_C0061G0012 [Berkelbacteria bacterium GW2011_GWA2_38_9]